MTAATAVRERPILFSGEMVRAILERQKTQTRRVANLSKRPGIAYEGYDPRGDEYLRCPYGQVGDRLWVRETWARLRFTKDWETGYVDGWEPVELNQSGEFVYDAEPHGFNDGGDTVEGRGFAWKPSIFMPRRASRIALEITGVRIERLQAISEDDAAAEGVEPGNVAGVDVDIDGAAWNGAYRRAFAKLWDSLNADRGYAWDVNPWVWVIGFRRVTP